MSGINTTIINSYATGITGVINNILVPLIITLCVIVFLWGVAKAYILSGGADAERKKGHQLILWGIIGFVVILSVWGLVNLALDIFGLTSGGTSPTPPTVKIS
jgi:hypothetical protein